MLPPHWDVDTLVQDRRFELSFRGADPSPDDVRRQVSLVFTDLALKGWRWRDAPS